MRRGLLLCWLCVLGGGCTETPRYRVVVHVPSEAAHAVRVDVWVVPTCGGVTLGEEPASPLAHAVVENGSGDGLGAIPTGRYGLYAVAWEKCVAFAAGCDPIDVGSDAGTLEVYLSGIDARGCAAGQACVDDACVGGDAGPGDDDPYATAVLADRPLGYWRFGERATPTAVDVSGNGNDGTYSSDVVLGVPGTLGSGDTAARFDGDDDVLTLGDRFGFTDDEAFTLEAWVRLDEDYDGVVCGKLLYVADSDTYEGYMLVIHIEGGTVTFYRGTRGQVDGPRPSPGVYHHLVVTFDGSLLSLYVDGIIAATAQDSGSLPPTPAPFEVAAGSQWSSLAADFDELAVYDHALSGVRIEQHFATASAD